jgi:nicotinamide riboside kinase
MHGVLFYYGGIMKVINLMGGPNTGKSTTAFGLTYELKRRGFRAEYVGEYVKDMVYEKRDNILDDQLYLLAKQNRRLERLIGTVDYVVTDSSLLAGLVYKTSKTQNELDKLIWECFNRYDNEVFYFSRNYTYTYDGGSRVQATQEEAEKFDKMFLNILPENAHLLNISNNYVEIILNILQIKEN